MQQKTMGQRVWIFFINKIICKNNWLLVAFIVGKRNLKVQSIFWWMTQNTIFIKCKLKPELKSGTPERHTIVINNFYHNSIKG